jgi:hypothetical protein
MARNLARTVYARVSATGTLRRPLAALRAHPRVRAFARRHVDSLLGPGATWANVDGALRLLAEDPAIRVVFGPWDDGLTGELLYWAPFIRWAQTRFAFDAARLGVVSASAGHLYTGVAGVRSGTVEEAREKLREAVVFPSNPVRALVDEYRKGISAPRPLLKRSRPVRLDAPREVAGRDAGRYVALALTATEAFPESEANRAAADRLVQTVSNAGRVELVGGPDDLPTVHGVVAAADGLVAAYSATAVLGALSGVPVVALRSADGHVVEADVDLAVRIVSGLGGSLTVLAAEHLDALVQTLGTAATRGTVT